MMAIPRTYVQDACEVVGYNTPKTVYDNYCKDIRAYEYYGYNYDIYMTNIIYVIIRDEYPDFDNYVASQSDGGFPKYSDPQQYFTLGFELDKYC